MSDLISRQAAIEIIRSMYPGMPRVPWMVKKWREQYEPYIRVEDEIKNLPSVQPKQTARSILQDLPTSPLLVGKMSPAQLETNCSEIPNNWIPCSERLPEDSQFVLMTIRRMDEHYNHEPFISVGYISWNQSAWWCAHDGDCEPNDVRVDAWMPLPEPYAERQRK